MGVLEPFEIAKNNYEKASKNAGLYAKNPFQNADLRGIHYLNKDRAEKALVAAKEEYELRERGTEYWREQMESVRLNHLYGDDCQKVGWVEPSKQD